MDFKEYTNKLLKRGSKPYKLSHCLGARDAWKYTRKNKWKALKGLKCSSDVYGEIINQINLQLVDALLDGHEIEFPYQMGVLRLISTPVKLEMVNGKLKNNYRTDWKKTLQCWYEDPYMEKQGKVIKRVSNNLYSIEYSKTAARFRNRSYYMFRANRSLVRELGKRVEEGRINSLIH